MHDSALVKTHLIFQRAAQTRKLSCISVVTNLVRNWSTEYMSMEFRHNQI